MLTRLLDDRNDPLGLQAMHLGTGRHLRGDFFSSESPPTSSPGSVGRPRAPSHLEHRDSLGREQTAELPDVEHAEAWLNVLKDDERENEIEVAVA